MISQNLIKIRKEKGIKQKDLAKELDIPYTTYNAYEIEKATPTIETIIKIAKYYNVTTDYLLGIEDDKTQKGTQTLNQKELLKKFNELNEMQQQRVIGFVESMIQNNINQNNNNSNKKNY